MHGVVDPAHAVAHQLGGRAEVEPEGAPRRVEARHRVARLLTRAAHQVEVALRAGAGRLGLGTGGPHEGQGGPGEGDSQDSIGWEWTFFSLNIHQHNNSVITLLRVIAEKKRFSVFYSTSFEFQLFFSFSPDISLLPLPVLFVEAEALLCGGPVGGAPAAERQGGPALGVPGGGHGGVLRRHWKRERDLGGRAIKGGDLGGLCCAELLVRTLI